MSILLYIWVRYSGFPVPSKLSVVTRTLSLAEAGEDAPLTPLAEMLDKDHNAPFVMPTIERILRILGMERLIACVSYAKLEDDDYFDRGDVMVLKKPDGPRWSCAREPWGISLISASSSDGTSPTDHTPLLSLLQVTLLNLTTV
jgi:hypothetical protein